MAQHTSKRRFQFEGAALFPRGAKIKHEERAYSEAQARFLLVRELKRDHRVTRVIIDWDAVKVTALDPEPSERPAATKPVAALLPFRSRRRERTVQTKPNAHPVLHQGALAFAAAR